MTPQQEQQLREQAKKRGYDKKREDAFVQFAASQGGLSPLPAAPVQTAAPAQKPGLLQRAGSFLKEQFTGQKNEYKGLLGSIVDETVGSKGLLGVAQMPGKTIGQFGLVKGQTATDESRAALAEQTRQLAIRIRTATDPEQKRKLQSLIDENRKALAARGESAA